MIASITLVSTHQLFAQRNCGTTSYQATNFKKHPNLEGRYSSFNYSENYSAEVAAISGIITIPIVFHIVYKKNEENIPDIEIQKQIKTLNEDYSGANTDASNIPAPFKNLFAGDCGIRFKVEKITRTKSNTDIFYMDDDNIKLTQFGGVDAGIYGTNKYLNVWIGNIAIRNPGDLCGYASFPGTMPINLDGVVAYYKVVGAPGLIPELNKGRTLTHEIGHWLNLQHLWGGGATDNSDCADDGVSDTPVQQYCNYGCPSYPKISCDNSPLGEMFMNYMDYVNDECMFMFSKKQKEKMLANFISNGPRVDIIRGNSTNLNLLINNARKDETSIPVVSKLNNDSLSWNKINDAISYTVTIKPIDKDTTFSFTTTKLSGKINGLDDASIYEIKIAANKSDTSIKNISNPVLFQPKKENKKVLFNDY